MTDTRTDEQKALERSQERKLHEQGFVRCEVYTANLALRAKVQVKRGPKLSGSNTDQGTFVPAWFEWHILRFPDDEENQRARIERTKELLEDKHEQRMLLVESQLCSGAIYDPAGDIGTMHALQLLEKELNGQSSKT